MKKNNEMKEFFGDKDLVKSFIGIGLSNVAVIFYCLVFSALGYVYQAFPGQESLAGLLVTIPGILACLGGYASSVYLRKFSAKSLMILSYSLMIAGGLICLFFGGHSLLVGVISVSVTGFAAGSHPSAKATAWAKISTPFMKDKMGWITLFYTFGWMVLNTTGAVFAAKTQQWNMVFVSTFYLIPILVAIIVLFPGEKETKRIRERYHLDEMDAQLIKSEEKEVKSFMPKSVIAIFFITFAVCLFYMALNLNASSYIINELAIGTSTTIAMVTNVDLVVGIFLNLALFAIMSKLKGLNSTVGLLMIGGGMLLTAFVPNLVAYIIGATIVASGMTIHNTGLWTVCAMAPKGKAVGTANGIINGTIYLGEAICVYAAPFVATLLFHNNLPSTAIKTGGILCVILAFVILPFFRSAYKDSFGSGKKEK